MKRFISISLSLFLIVNMFLPMVSTSQNAFAANDREWKAPIKDVPTDKIWTITLNKAVNKNIDISNFIYVLDSNVNVVETELLISSDYKEVNVQPPLEGYESNADYTLVIEEGLKSAEGKKLIDTRYQKFTTNNTKVSLTDFTPREDSKNEAVLKDTVHNISDNNFLRVIDENTIELKKNYKTGDILALPPNDEYPFGYFKKITAIQNQDGKLVATVIDPELEEVLEDIDISSIGQIDAKDFILEDSLTDNNFSSEYEKRLGKVHTSATVEQNKNKITINLKDIGIEKKMNTPNKESLINLTGSGGIKVSGQIVIDEIKPIADIKLDKGFLGIPKLEINEVGMKMQPSYGYTIKTYGNLKGEAKIKLGKVPVPYLSVKGIENIEAGAFIYIYLVISVGINGDVTATLKQEYNAGAGIKKGKGYAYYDRIEQEPEDPVGKATIQAGVGPRLETKFKIGNLELTNITLATPVTLNVTPEKFLESKQCYNYQVNLNADINVEVKKLYSYKSTDNLLLYNGSSCKLDNLYFVEQGPVGIKAGASHQINLRVEAGNVTEILKLPQNQISFSSDNKYVKIDNSGLIKVKNSAEDGMTATITVKYDEGIAAKKIKEEIEIFVVKDEEPEVKEPEENEINQNVEEIKMNPNEGNSLNLVKHFRIDNSKGLEDVKVTVPGVAYYSINNRKARADKESYIGVTKEALNVPYGTVAYISYTDSSLPEPKALGNVAVEKTTQPAWVERTLNQGEALQFNKDFKNEGEILVVSNTTTDIVDSTWIMEEEKPNFINNKKLINKCETKGNLYCEVSSYEDFEFISDYILQGEIFYEDWLFMNKYYLNVDIDKNENKILSNIYKDPIKIYMWPEASGMQNERTEQVADYFEILPGETYYIASSLNDGKNPLFKVSGQYKENTGFILCGYYDEGYGYPLSNKFTTSKRMRDYVEIISNSTENNYIRNTGEEPIYVVGNADSLSGKKVFEGLEKSQLHPGEHARINLKTDSVYSFYYSGIYFDFSNNNNLIGVMNEDGTIQDLPLHHEMGLLTGEIINLNDETIDLYIPTLIYDYKVIKK